jgi:uncharacterized protein (DUF1684 family)
MLRPLLHRLLRHAFPALLTWLLVLPAAAPTRAQNPKEADADAYRREVESWYQRRLRSLKRPEGYLSLVGLFPLGGGENRFGSAADNDLVFPSKAPSRAGAFVVEDGTVRVEVNPGVEITEDGAPVTSGRLKTDSGGEPTVLAMGSLRFYVIDRSGDLYVRLKDRDSELLKHFDGIDRFPVSAAWRIQGRLEPYNPPRRILVPNVLGGEFEELCPGRVVFQVAGDTLSLEPASASNGRLFFVFGDGTSGLETYGGGRFLVADPPAEDGTVILDFNKAYNPPCAFTPFATCPLPPDANHLAVRVEAGEKKWGEGH